MDYKEDNVNLLTNILDFSIDNELRVNLFEKYFETHSENDSLELLNRIIGMFQFSGIKVLETFLFFLTNQSSISSILKLEASKALLLYEDKLEKIKKNDNNADKTIFFMCYPLICHVLFFGIRK